MKQSIDTIANQLYDGILSEQAWHDALDSMCLQVQAGVFHYFTLDPSGAPTPESAGNLESHGLHTGLMAEYELQHAANDLRLAATLRLQPGQLMFDHEHISQRELSRNSVYADWLVPLGFRNTAGVCVRAEGSARDYMSFMRYRDDKVFSERDKTFINALTPHVMRASGLRARMQSLTLQASLGLAALDSLSQGIVLLDAQARIHYANTAAERLTQAPSALGTAQGRLLCRSPALQARMQQLLAQACASPAQAGAFEMGASQATRLVVTVLPLKASHALSNNWQKPLALVVLVVPGAISALDHRVVCDMLGLSPSEARLLLLLVAGKSVKDFAAVEGCSWHTARSHLKNLMRKTGCHRQLELVQLLQALQLG